MKINKLSGIALCRLNDLMQTPCSCPYLCVFSYLHGCIFLCVHFPSCSVEKLRLSSLKKSKYNCIVQLSFMVMLMLMEGGLHGD